MDANVSELKPFSLISDFIKGLMEPPQVVEWADVG